MKSNQIQTRMSREYIEIIAKLARSSHMTPAAMLRRLVLERLEELFSGTEGLERATGKGLGGKSNEN